MDKEKILFFDKNQIIEYSEEQIIIFAKQKLLFRQEWNCISRFQKISENFIRKFKNKISWMHLRYNKEIQVSDEFTIEFDEELGWFNMWKINNEYHRILGPANIYNHKKEYWYRGKQVEVNSDEEYFEWLKYYKDF